MQSNAEAIFPDGPAASGNSKKSRRPCWRFSWGAFGAHKFYLGYNAQGIIMLLVFLFGFILLGVPSMIIGLIAFIEFIIYLTKTGRRLRTDLTWLAASLGSKPSR